MPSTRLLVVSALSLTLGASSDAWSCSCASGGPPCQNTFEVDAVFVGTVERIVTLPDGGPPLEPGESRPGNLRVDFTGVTVFRGGRAPSMSVSTPNQSSTCGYGFTQGERYVVYATRTADGTGLVTGICSRTRPLAEAGDDIRFLQTLARSRDVRARVSGTITHWERELATGAPLDQGPVAEVLVTVRGESSAFHATTDERGHYEVTVPPGRYDVTASPAAPFSAPDPPRGIELRDARACTVVDFGVSFNGRITGSVRHASGEPAAGVPVQVMAAQDVGKAGNIQALRAPTDEGGRFEFTDVSPGRYVVGVDLTRDMDPTVVFPPTFYPGTVDGALATVVQLDGGEQRELASFALPAPMRSSHLTGSVVFDNGIPVSGAFVSLSDGAASWRQVAVGIKTESPGTFSFVVHEGLSYVIRASYWDEARRTSVSATSGPFVAGLENSPVQVVLSTEP